MTTMSSMAAVALAGIPFLVIVGLFALAEWRDRTRTAAVARQIALTDAISRELGAVVAPVVRKRGRGFRVEVAAPLARAAIVGRIVAIADHVLAGEGHGRRPYEIVLTPQDAAPVVAAARAVPVAATRLQAA
jgi:hypothetical protein